MSDDAPVSLIKRKLEKTPSPDLLPQSPKSSGATSLPPPVPLSSSTPHSKTCCQSAANAGQPFCPTCYVTAILANHKSANNGQQQNPNSSNSDNGGSSASPTTPPIRNVSPQSQSNTNSNNPAAEMLALLQQAAAKVNAVQERRPSPQPLVQPELFLQQILAAGQIPPPPPPHHHQQNPQQQTPQFDIPPQFLPRPMPVPPGATMVPPPPGFGPNAPFLNAGPEHMMNPYFGSPFDINGMRRKNATRETTAVLKQWLAGHRKNPYPTKGEKIMLAIISKMTLTQVSTWFANARRRLKKENKGNATWNSGGAGCSDDMGGSNDGDDIELQVDDESGGEMTPLPNVDDDDDVVGDDDDNDEPPQRRARLEQNNNSNEHDEHQSPISQVAEQNPNLAASLANLIEQQKQQQQQQQQQQQSMPNGMNPLQAILQQSNLFIKNWFQLGT